jgi:SAM-dependent methyltransferase
MKRSETRKLVRKAYGKIALAKDGCGCDTCGPDAREFARSIGYSEEELKAIPDEANLALSCGNPIALAGLKKGETVVDLGSGAGFDCFLASDKVGRNGKIIGIDMTPQMIEKARENAKQNKTTNVEFRLGEIERLPVADSSVDAVISNCVINLSPDKRKVFQEIYRVLKPGGRIAISDIALNKKLPEKVQKNMDAYVGCISGALLVDEYKKYVESSGLQDVKITSKGTSSCIDPDTKDPIGRAILDSLEDGQSLDEYAVSIYIEARK